MFVAVALGFCLVDWSAVWFDRARLEAWAKPLVLATLIAAVVVDGPNATGWLVVAALFFSLVGDVLLLPTLDRFLAGLASFFAAHVVYVVAFVRSWDLDDAQTRSLLLAGASAAVALWLLVGRRIIAESTQTSPTLGLAVRLYILVLSAMLVAGFGVGSVVLALGALLFALSDGLLGWNRFVAHLPHGRLATHVLYHLGQTLFAVWALDLS